MNRRGLYPDIEPYRTGTLQVSDLHRVFYEEAGNPDGRPALFLHGGPGVGILPGYRRFFDPEHYRIVLPDQRGAGRSTPHAELRENTTWDLIEDLETLRRTLGIENWIVMGGSWGSLLALCYAISHPTSVAGLIVRGVFLGRPSEVAWLHRAGGASRIFPDEWLRYRSAVADTDEVDTVAAYLQRLTDEDETVRTAAAKAWARWQSATMTLIPDEAAMAEIAGGKSALAIARIECTYTHNGFFLNGDNHVLENADRIAEIPCRIVQGRYDIICPTVSAWDLHAALPASELTIVPDGSHSPMEPGMAAALVGASDDFKRLGL